VSKAHIFVAVATGVGLIMASGAGTAATTKCNYAKIAEWPARLENGEIIVDGTINGKKVGIMLDTGTERSLILRRAAARLALNTQAVPGARIIGVDG
jgi:predicted aspartyl protease